jgi:hypothetical protein
VGQVVVSDMVILQHVVQFEFPAGKALRPVGNLGYEKARIDQSGLAWTQERNGIVPVITSANALSALRSSASKRR